MARPIFRAGKISTVTAPRSPSASKSIRLYCLDCAGCSKEVKLCAAEVCTLYPYRFGGKPKGAVSEVISYPLEQGLTHQEAMELYPGLAKQIKRKCIDCSGGNKVEAKGCSHEGCPLFPYRMGKSPNKRKLTPQQREVLSTRLAIARNPHSSANTAL